MHPKLQVILFTTVCSIMYSTSAKAQETISHEETEESDRPYHRVTIAMANAHITASSETEGKRKNFVIPAWCIDYDYWFNGKLAIGLHNDVILQQYKIEEIGDKKDVIRSFPISVTLVGLFKPAKHWVLIAGVGKEFEKNETLNLIDLGIEYGWELQKEWELSLNLNYEHKFTAYDTYLFGLGISKKLFTKKK